MLAKFSFFIFYTGSCYELFFALLADLLFKMGKAKRKSKHARADPRGK